MTLILRIENFDSLENGGPLSFTVDGRGASIGRRTANDWVLPDPDRHISGTHFEITFSGGAYFLVDVSTNGTFLQGQSYRLDGPHPIKDGDRFTVGHYVIAAALPSMAASAPAPHPVPVPPQHAAPPPQQTHGFQQPSPPPAAEADDPWDWGDIGVPPAAPAPTSGLQQPPTSQAPVPFPGQAPHPGAAPGQPGTQSPPSFGAGASMSGLRMPPSTQAPVSPVTQMPPGSPQAQPVTAFGAGAQPGPAGDMPTGFGGAIPPPAAAQPPAYTPGPSAAPAPSELPMPTPRAPAPNPTPIPAAGPGPLPTRTPPPAASAGGGDAQAFLRAFCEGAGVDPSAYADLDAEALGRKLGEVVRISATEVTAMLTDRTNVKLFTRGGERTERSATGNNPMKFMPDAEQAIEAMFLKQRQGFMDGPAAFSNALGDVRQHQQAVFAALQPALAHVLAGLSPDEVLELSDGGLLSGGGRSKAWEKYVELWDAKAAQGENGMLDVFLKAFAESYARAIGGRR